MKLAGVVIDVAFVRDDRVLARFNPAQRRDRHGRWTEIGEETEKVMKWMRSLDDVEQLSADVQVLQSVDADHIQLTGGRSGTIVEIVGFVDEKHRGRIRTAIHKRPPAWGDPEDSRTQADAEQLGALTHRALGSRAAGVYRDDAEAIWMEYVPGGSLGEAAEHGDGDFHARYTRWTSSNEYARMGLADTLMAMPDRHDGNIMIDDDGEFVAIDHGFAFGGLGYFGGDGKVSADDLGGSLDDGRPSGLFAEGVEVEGERHNQFVNNPLTKADVDEARGRLESLRPDFKHIGREDWLNKMLDMLDLIGEHATGGGSIFDD
jgi:hypothetical protein